MSIHHSTCLNIKPDMTESGLWVLPTSDDLEFQSKYTPTPPPTQSPNRWSRLLLNAASSNRQRHRARLEGEGWSFVGEKYDEDEETGSGESVDEEFDVVVLPRETVGC